nr:EOG090X08SX [Polyphemus pediculus]
MNANNDLHLDSEFPCHPYEKSGLEFANEAKKRIDNLLEDQKQKNPVSFERTKLSSTDSHDTWIFPFIQMGQLGIYMDNIYTQKILENVPPNAELSLATGYFNLTHDYMNSLLFMSQPNVHILMAHPNANGFLGARGFAGGIPSAYTLLASQFYQRVRNRAHGSRIKLWEYQRSFWTFHAKGLWISCTGADSRPFFTLIGSPNFGYRSVYRDLESQLAIVTVNSSLRNQLHEERRNLFQSADPVTPSTYVHPDRSIPLWVRFVIKVFRHFF